MLTRRTFLWNLLALVAAFFTYYCMYAFRKPFSVLEFEGQWLGMGLKEVVVVSQMLGYTTAKFLGTRLCSGLHREGVFKALSACIAGALLGLLMMATLPIEWAFACMFLNGLSLGMVWGIVMRPLEGRTSSEFLMAGLCCSFIVASGDVKSVSKWLLEQSWFDSLSGGNPLWMPVTVGFMFLLPFAAASLLLVRVPKPDQSDIAARGERHAMTKQQCVLFMKRWAQVLIPLAVVYLMLTAYRDYRDNFQADLLGELGVHEVEVFSQIERVVAFVVVSITALVMLFKKHLNALRASMLVMALGLVLCVVATLLRQFEYIEATSWMVATGIGAYLCYIPFNCILFERMVALTKSPGNAVFAIMLFDGIGYIGSMTLTFTSGMLGATSRLQFFDDYSIIMGIIGVAAILWSFVGISNVTSLGGSRKPTRRSSKAQISVAS